MSSPARAHLTRRDLLRLAGGTAAAVAAALWLPGMAAAAGTFSPIRPPATPLIVRSPYLSTWQPADNLPGAWASFWTGHVTALCGLARIDGVAYVFAGSPALPSGPALTPMTQVSLQVTGTRSTYVLTGGGVNLTVTFFSPVDPANLQRQCVPFGYVTIQATAVDGRAHAVDLHFDTSAEWVHGDTSTPVTWTQQQSGGYTLLSCTPANPGVLQENGDQASWGRLVLAAPTSGTSWQIGQDTFVRAASAGQGGAEQHQRHRPAPRDQRPLAGPRLQQEPRHDPGRRLLDTLHALDRARPHARGPVPRHRAQPLVDALLGQLAGHGRLVRQRLRERAGRRDRDRPAAARRRRRRGGWRNDR